MGALEIVEQLRRSLNFRLGNSKVKADARDPALVAVDNHRGDCGAAGVDAVSSEIADRLFFDTGQRDAVHAPHARQARRQFDPRVQRPLIVAADYHQAVAAAERRGDRRNQALARMERADVDRLAVDQTLDELIRSADENRDDDGRGLRNFSVAKDERQRQRGCFVTDPGCKVRGDLDIGHRRRRRDDDPGRDGISEAVTVGVARQAQWAHERRQRLRAPGLSVERRKGGDREAAERGGEGQQGESALHLTAILRRPKSIAGKTKGHRVIAMPPCSTGLAPPAFTAPCRNQTSDPTHEEAIGVPACLLEKRLNPFDERSRRMRILCSV
jgi:hypothetical protein